jgi:hypothetical protein
MVNMLPYPRLRVGPEDFGIGWIDIKAMKRMNPLKLRRITSTLHT